MPNVDDGILLAARINAARAAWLEVERAADDYFDDELDGRIACARLAILDAGDRLAQLLRDERDELGVAVNT